MKETVQGAKPTRLLGSPLPVGVWGPDDDLRHAASEELGPIGEPERLNVRGVGGAW